MTSFPDYEKFDATGLADLVQKGDVTPVELCEAAIERIEKRNPGLNAIVTPMLDIGRKTAQGPIPDGPFFGVPFLIKDLLAHYAGVPTSGGCRALKNFTPDHDSEMVSRLKNAGLVILGKTSTPEFGLKGVTEPELFGPCRNPWNPDCTPGGSSGGSAAAVAAGIVPMASAGDGGGSIRIPAAYCGLFGLKPTRGRNPSGPDGGRTWQDAVQEHVVARSVRDSAAMLDATHGPDTGAPYVIKPPAMPYRDEMKKDPGKLRVAFCTRSPIGTKVHPECITGIQKTARLLEDLGHHVEEAEPEIDGRRLAESYLIMYFGEVAADIHNLSNLIGRKARIGDVEDLTWTLGLLGNSFSAGEFVEAIRVWDTAARQMGKFFSKYDIYLTPVTAVPPLKISELDPKPAEMALMKVINKLGLGKMLKASGIVAPLAEKSFEKMPFTQLANLTGLPAMSVPLHWTPDNLPVGSHFIAPSGDEATLFRLAAQLEKARPWFDRRPPEMW
ncbi:MAG: amidase [Desulfosalsimonadaceae bacterium]